MPRRKKRKARAAPQRHVSVRPVYRDKPDTKALAKALVLDVLMKNRDADNHSVAEDGLV